MEHVAAGAILQLQILILADCLNFLTDDMICATVDFYLIHGIYV